MSLTDAVIKRPSIVVVIFAVLGTLGILGFTKLNYELMPKFDIPVVSVMTMYPGASPSEVENSVTKKIEDALSTVENLDEIRSTSMESVSSVVLMLKPNSNSNLAIQEAQRKINAIASQLPDDVQSPALGKFSFDDMPVIRLGVTARIAPAELYALVKDEITPALGKIKGAGQVSIVGGQEREIKIQVNHEQSELMGISLQQIVSAIQRGNMEFPTGKIKSDESQSMIRLLGKYSSTAEIEQIIVATDRITGSPVRLSEIANVIDGLKDSKTFNRIDGVTSIGLLISKQSDANTVELSKLVKKELKNIEQIYAAKQLQFDIASDGSDFTLAAANAVVFDIALAVIIVALCMLLFLHSLRNAAIVMVAIPASLISVFAVMYVLNFSLNLMTLLAISLVVGILVDDSIVVLENIHRYLEKGYDKVSAARKGRSEIGFTAVGITLVDVVVFLPITLVGGLISNLLLQFSIVIVISTLMSLFVSFTLTPLLASRISKAEHINTNTLYGKLIAAFERLITWLTYGYTHVLNWALGHKRYVLGFTTVLLIASFGLVGGGYIGMEFVSQGDTGEYVINLELPQNATVEQTNQATLTAERFLFSDPTVTHVFTSVGTASGQMGTSSSAANKAELNVKLIDKKQRSQTSSILAKMMKLELEKILPNVKVSSAAISITGNANQAPIQISVTGNSLKQNFQTADSIMYQLQKMQGTSEVKLSVDAGNPEISVSIDRDKMSELGLSMDVVGMNMQSAYSGNTNTKYSDMGKEYDINVMADENNRKSVEDLGKMSFTNSRGEVIFLSQFATLGQSTSPSKLERKNRIPSVTVTSQVLGVSSGTITNNMQAWLKTAKIPPGIIVGFEGNAKNMAESFGNLGFALMVSILFVYLIMVALYNSYIYPFVVLFSIPVAVVGALLGLALSMQPLSIFSMLGMIMLIGLVAKNAILIVDFANQLKASGLDTVHALMLAGKTRLRPILMTTLAMVFGMMPIALASGAGAEWKSGLAWVLIGGLLSSMLLTLVVVPSVYLIVDIMKREITNKNAKKLLEVHTADAIKDAHAPEGELSNDVAAQLLFLGADQK